MCTLIQLCGNTRYVGAADIMCSPVWQHVVAPILIIEEPGPGEGPGLGIETVVGHFILSWNCEGLHFLISGTRFFLFVIRLILTFSYLTIHRCPGFLEGGTVTQYGARMGVGLSGRGIITSQEAQEKAAEAL